MRWLGDLVVYVGLITFVAFFAYVAIKSRRDAEKDDAEKNKNKAKPQ
jgi:hypothetical protein